MVLSCSWSSGQGYSNAVLYLFLLHDRQFWHKNIFIFFMRIWKLLQGKNTKYVWPDYSWLIWSWNIIILIDILLHIIGSQYFLWIALFKRQGCVSLGQYLNHIRVENDVKTKKVQRCQHQQWNSCPETWSCLLKLSSFHISHDLFHFLPRKCAKVFVEKSCPH